MSWSPLHGLRFRHLLWPRRIGNQCLLMLVVGALLGRLAPGATGVLQPLATLFLQLSQVVVMPYLICELIVGFGGLSSSTLRTLLRGGVLVLAGLWLAAGLLVVLLPPLLPPVEYSGFFHSGLFQDLPETDLLRTFVPDNIFTALAADNFPAVVLFSALLGILLQRLDGREELLRTLELVRRLFAELNRLTARIIPFGILALSALSFAQLDPARFARMQGLLLLCLVSLVVLSLALAGTVLALTPLGPAAFWRILRGPLAFTASSANLLVALPMLVSNLQQELPRAQARVCGSGGAPNPPAIDLARELAPLVSLGFSLPTLGQVACLIFVPFAGWYVNQPLGPGRTAQMLATGIPTTVAGLKVVIRQELLRQGLPLNLLELVYLNAEWLYRFEKVLSLLGLVVLAVLVYYLSCGALRLRPLQLAAGLLASLGLGAALLGSGRAALATALAHSYRNDAILLGLQPLVAAPPPAPLAPLRPAPVTMAAIRRRGVLRVGLRRDAVPWAFRNRQGQLVGYDVDLIQALAQASRLRLEVTEAPLEQLDLLLNRGAIDLAVGGIQGSPLRAQRHQVSRGYEAVHLALVVPDAKVARLQQLANAPPALRSHPPFQPAQGRRLRIAAPDSQVLSPHLERQMVLALGGGRRALDLAFEPLADKRQFFSAEGQRRYDALLTTAEGGASWAVLHPETSLLAPFGDHFNSELVILVGGQDPIFLAYVNSWLLQEKGRGLMADLFRHWITVQE